MWNVFILYILQMAFSEIMTQDNWIEGQIKETLKESNDELSSLKDLVLSSDKKKLQWKLDKVIKVPLNGPTITQEVVKDIWVSDAIKILKTKQNLSRNKIYGKNGAGTIFAVQYVLNGLGYSIKNIDGVIGPETKVAVKRFQEEWNKKNVDDKITADGLPGGQTIAKMVSKIEKIIPSFPWKKTETTVVEVIPEVDAVVEEATDASINTVEVTPEVVPEVTPEEVEKLTEED